MSKQKKCLKWALDDIYIMIINCNNPIEIFVSLILRRRKQFPQQKKQVAPSLT